MDSYFVVKLFHIGLASVYFGSNWLVSRDIRRSLQLGKPLLEYLVERVDHLERIVIPTGLLTFVTGLGLIFLAGGFAAVPWRIHVSLVLMFLLFIVGSLLASPTWRKISLIITNDGDLNSAGNLGKKFSDYLAIEHVLRIVILILMVIHF